MSERNHSDRVRQENQHCWEVLLQIELVEQDAAEDHGYLHLEDVKD